MDIQKILTLALENTSGKKIGINSIGELEKIIKKSNVPLELFFAEAALIASKSNVSNQNKSPQRSTIKFQIAKRPTSALIYTNSPSVKWHLEPKIVIECVIATNKLIEIMYHMTLLYNIDLFHILGIRNLSSFVGELFAKELHSFLRKNCIPNPNQDGYPDLCALTPEGREYIDKHLDKEGKILPNKEFWSFYSYGGIEIKATCGNTPAASKMKKLLMGESRLPFMTTAEWKAHHQRTKILLGLYWDFVDGMPTILAAFFRNDLDTTIGERNNDWGKIVKPKESGGRTTSVSVMKRGSSESEGVKKMGQGWMVLPCNKEYLTPIARVFCLKV